MLAKCVGLSIVMFAGFLMLRGPMVGACWCTMRYAEQLLQRHVGTKSRAVKPASYAVASSASGTASVSAEQEAPSSAEKSGGEAAAPGNNDDGAKKDDAAGK